MSAKVAMSAVIAARVDTSAILGPASGLPVVALKPSTVPSLLAFVGIVISMLSGSPTGALTDLFNVSALSPSCMVIVSKSVSKDAAVILPPAVYTLVLDLGTSDFIATL